MSVQKDCEDFLKNLYSTLEQRTMNYRHEEHMFLQFFITLTLGVLGAIGIIEKFDSSDSAENLTFYLLLIVIGSGIWTIVKIIIAHKGYENVGKTIVEIWKRCGLFDMGVINERAKNYGRGRSFFLSIFLVIGLMLTVGYFLLSINLT